MCCGRPDTPKAAKRTITTSQPPSPAAKATPVQSYKPNAVVIPKTDKQQLILQQQIARIVIPKGGTGG